PSGLLVGGALAGGAPASRGQLWMATSRAALAFAAGRGHETTVRVRTLAGEAFCGSTAPRGKGGLLFLLATVAGAGAAAYWMPMKPPEAREATNDWPMDWPKGRDGNATRADRLGDPLPPGAIARLGTVRLRPGQMMAGIGQLSFSPDGKRLV